MWNILFFVMLVMLLIHCVIDCKLALKPKIEFKVGKEIPYYEMLYYRKLENISKKLFIAEMVVFALMVLIG